MRFLTAVLLLCGTAFCGCVEPGSHGSSASGLMGVRSQEAPAQRSYTCPTCGGTYAQAGNCPKCGLELTPKEDSAPKGNFK